MKKHLLISLLILAAFTVRAKADSPITSTDFYTAYSDVDMVQKASDTKVMTAEIADYLSSPEVPVDMKAAVINALAWDFDGKDNAKLYRYYLGLKYKRAIAKLKYEDLTRDEVFCLGYLTIMDDYFSPEGAIDILQKAFDRGAKVKNPKDGKNSYTVAMILALAKAQKNMDGDWCQVFLLADEVNKDKNLDLDMRPAAIEIIMNYMDMYQDSCK